MQCDKGMQLKPGCKERRVLLGERHEFKCRGWTLRHPLSYADSEGCEMIADFRQVNRISVLTRPRWSLMCQ